MNILFCYPDEPISPSGSRFPCLRVKFWEILSSGRRLFHRYESIARERYKGAPVAASPPRTARKCSVAATSADATAPLLLPGFLPITLSAFQAPVPSRREAKASGLETGAGGGGFLPSKKWHVFCSTCHSAPRGATTEGGRHTAATYTDPPRSQPPCPAPPRRDL